MPANKYNYDSIKELLETYIEPAQLAKYLNEIIFQHSIYCLRDTDTSGGNEDAAERLCWLKKLQGAFEEMEPTV